jgi:hypothetical protein
MSFGDIPQELKEQPTWVCWRLEKRKNKKGEEKDTKIPVNPLTGIEAKTNNPKTWTTFQEALEASKRFSGIGFMFSADSPFCGIDLDDCRNPETGQITSEAQEIINQFSSYTDITQSGKGVHIYIKAKLEGGGRKRNKREIYDKGRFFVMTGNHLEGTPKTIEDRQELAVNFWESLAPVHKTAVKTSPPCGNLEDREIIEKAKNAKNGSKFASLFSGDFSGYSSQSEADLALCSMLAFYTQEKSQIDQIFRSSGLYREEKWGRGDYREDTLQRALTGLTENYNPKPSNRLKQEIITTREEEKEELQALPQKQDIPLPLEKIHPLFKTYFSEFEGKTEAPMEFILSSFLVSLAGAIGNKVSISSGLKSTIKPNMYMMLIGDSTFLKKTTSLNYGMATLRELNTERKRCFLRQIQEILPQAKGEKKEPRPQQSRPKDESFFYPDDITLEQLLVKMQDKPDGLFALSELGAFLARMESGYGSGLKEMLTSLFDGKADYLRETKTSGSFLVKNPAPSLIGASTFQWLQAHLKDGDLLSGFLGRFLYVVRRSYPTIDIPFQKPFQLDEKIWKPCFQDITELSLNLELSQEAEESFSLWYSDFKKKIFQEETFLHSPLGRLKDEYCHKIAIINHILDRREQNFKFDKPLKPNVIEKRSYELAYPWIEFFAENVKSCYQELTQKLNFLEIKIIETIKKKGKEEGGFKTLARSYILQNTNLNLKDFLELTQTLIAKKQLSEFKKGNYSFYKIKL